MAKFCTRCGRPLEEGEICKCPAIPVGQAQTANRQYQSSQPSQQQFQQPPEQQYQQPSQQQYQQPANQNPQPNYNEVITVKPNALAKYFKVLCECFKAYFKDSAKTLGLCASHLDIRTGLSYAALNCILVSLFFVACIKTVFDTVFKYTSTITDTLGGPASSTISGVASLIIKVPYFEIFLFTLVLAAAVYFGTCVIGMLIGAITGKRAPFTAFMASIGTSSLPSCIVMILAVIFSFFWLPGATALVVVALFTWLISTYAAIKETLQITDAKISIYYGLFISILLGIIYFIALQAEPHVLGSITVGGETLNSIFSNLMSSISGL